MASAFSHAFVAFTLGTVTTVGKMPFRFWILGIFCAVIPDADVLAFRLGIPYGDFWGHRGFTHSLVFAVLLAVVIVALFFPKSCSWRRLRLVFYFFLCTASHGLLDAMTNGGLGVAFFAPFDNTRYFLPWRPIHVSPVSASRFFSQWGDILWNEGVWVGIPCLGLMIGGFCAHRMISVFRKR